MIDRIAMVVFSHIFAAFSSCMLMMGAIQFWVPNNTPFVLVLLTMVALAGIVSSIFAETVRPAHISNSASASVLASLMVGIALAHILHPASREQLASWPSPTVMLCTMLAFMVIFMVLHVLELNGRNSSLPRYQYK